MFTTLVILVLLGVIVYQALKNTSKDVSIISYIKLLFYFRRKDLVTFCKQHDKLFQEAQKKNDYAEVTSHFYDVMAEVIEQAYGSSFHFSPKYYDGQSNNDALKMLHQKLAYYLDLKPGKKALELGCGVGGSLRDFALHSGAQMTGISLSKEEVAENNRLSKAGKLDLLCNAIQGDMRSLPFEPNTFDSVIGIYTLKYIPDEEVPKVMNQVSRVLKKGGKFLVYCLMKSEKFNKQLKEHSSVFDKFEYSCGMPPIHHVSEVIDFAGKAGLKIQSKIELSQDPETAWYTVFTSGKLLMWSLQSDLVRKLIWVAEKLAILPAGFDHFLDIFVRGNVLSITKAAQMGIMSGSEVLIFEKQ